MTNKTQPGRQQPVSNPANSRRNGSTGGIYKGQCLNDYDEGYDETGRIYRDRMTSKKILMMKK